MQSFTIRDIENLTGIKAHTLRIWEQRYQFFQSKRKDSLHRFYDNEDLKKLLQISLLYHNGWKVSRIASLSSQEVLQEIEKAEAVDGGHARFVTSLIEAAVDFDEGKFVAILNNVAEKLGFERTIVEVAYPYLKKVGLLWTTNNVIPAQEHFSSYIIQNKIIVETDRLPAVNKKPEVILICPQGEYHELPLLFINYMFRKNGWSTIYLGTNIKRSELLHFSSFSSIRYVYLHLITNFTGFEADDYLEDICTNFPDKKIIASGEGIKKVQRTFTNLTLLQTDADIVDFIMRPSRSGAHGF